MESTPRTVIGVLAVQGDVVEHVRMLEDVGAHAVRVRRAADLANVDALVIPGGTVNSDKLRLDEAAVAFVGEFVRSGKPVAAICHAPWVLLEAGVVADRTLTSYPSLRTDLRNAGATVVDQEVCVDGNLITSRSPDDLPAFCQTITDRFAENPAHT